MSQVHDTAQTRLSPRVSVVMVVYRTGAVLADSVRAALADRRVAELVVVDNGATPIEAAILKQAAADDRRVVLIAGQGNVGFARGVNLGAAQATGEVLIMLNPDAAMRPGCVEAMASEIARHPVPSVVGARILDPDGSEQRGARRGEVTLASTLLSLTGLARVPGLTRFQVNRQGEARPSAPIAVPTISGACFALRRADFDALGGLDEGYFLHVEDIDLCWRARQAGGEVIFHPLAEAMHLAHSSAASSAFVEGHKARGFVRYFRKRAEGPLGRAAVTAVAPLIYAAALVRPVLWKLRGKRPG